MNIILKVRNGKVSNWIYIQKDFYDRLRKDKHRQLTWLGFIPLSISIFFAICSISRFIFYCVVPFIFLILLCNFMHVMTMCKKQRVVFKRNYILLREFVFTLYYFTGSYSWPGHILTPRPLIITRLLYFSIRYILHFSFSHPLHFFFLATWITVTVFLPHGMYIEKYRVVHIYAHQ